MRETSEIWLILAMSALITFGLRAFPFFVFRGKRTMPAWLDRLGKALPPLIMAVLVVYCLKDATTDPGHTGIAQAAGVLATALIYKWRHNTFLGIILGTVVYICMLSIL